MVITSDLRSWSSIGESFIVELHNCKTKAGIFLLALHGFEDILFKIVLVHVASNWLVLYRIMFIDFWCYTLHYHFLTNWGFLYPIQGGPFQFTWTLFILCILILILVRCGGNALAVISNHIFVQFLWMRGLGKFSRRVIYLHRFGQKPYIYNLIFPHGHLLHLERLEHFRNFSFHDDSPGCRRQCCEQRTVWRGLSSKRKP